MSWEYNDYKLINSLLEDGSDAAILKLKMIVDVNHEHFYFSFLNNKNTFNFAMIFKGYFIQLLKDTRGKVFGHIDKNDRLNCVKAFRENFSEVFKKDPFLVCWFSEEDTVEIFSMFKDCFYVYIEKNTYHITSYHSDNIFKVLEMFKESFNVVFKKEPKIINEIDFEYRNKVKEMFPNIKFP